MRFSIALLEGDGIGPEIMAEAVKVLIKIGESFDHAFIFKHGLIGGSAWEKCGEHFPAQTKELCENSDAILFGAVGGPIHEQSSLKWRRCEMNSILQLRKTFGFQTNLRPVKVYPSLEAACVLRPDIIAKGVDILLRTGAFKGYLFRRASAECRRWDKSGP